MSQNCAYCLQPYNLSGHCNNPRCPTQWLTGNKPVDLMSAYGRNENREPIEDMIRRVMRESVREAMEEVFEEMTKDMWVKMPSSFPREKPLKIKISPTPPPETTDDEENRLCAARLQKIKHNKNPRYSIKPALKGNPSMWKELLENAVDKDDTIGNIDTILSCAAGVEWGILEKKLIKMGWLS